MRSDEILDTPAITGQEQHLFWGLWYIISIIILSINKQRRTLHDFMAGTIVVQSHQRH
jgi:uncharacterized RDD family membrane protein YckC